MPDSVLGKRFQSYRSVAVAAIVSATSAVSCLFVVLAAEQTFVRVTCMWLFTIVLVLPGPLRVHWPAFGNQCIHWQPASVCRSVGLLIWEILNFGALHNTRCGLVGFLFLSAWSLFRISRSQADVYRIGKVVSNQQENPLSKNYTHNTMILEFMAS